MAEEFDIVVDDDFFFDFDPSDVINSSIGEIESQLMNDNNHELELDHQSVSDFLADLIVDPVSPEENKSGSEVHDADTAENADLIVDPVSPDDDGENKSGSEVHDADTGESDKKRRRRMRNRDAAVRSRERKKDYVKDLESKSKYLERECIRLGRMLQCFAAENQSLRLCLQKGGNDASMSKQESAVLFLESLLLGSLLWYLGAIICQFPLPQSKSQSLSLENQEPGKLVRSGLGSSTPLQLINWKNRRCKGSRPRMKQVLIIVE